MRSRRLLLIPALLQVSITPGITSLYAQDTVDVTISGVIRDNGGAVLTFGFVYLPALRLRVQADSTGHFRVPLRVKPGCYELVARHIGFGPTVQAVHVRPGLTVLDAGTLPLQSAAIPETNAFVVGECAPNGRTRYGADFGRTRKDSAP